MQNKPTLAYIGHIYHQKTGSTLFLENLLEEHFNVSKYWIDPWGSPRVIPVDEINTHEYTVFFQRLSPLEDLRKVTSKITWVPMSDSISNDFFFWKALSTLPIKILSFSRHASAVAEPYGIQTLTVKYFPDPKNLIEYRPVRNNKKILFWYRGDITFETIKRIIRPEDIESVTYRSAPDPNYKPENISQEDIQKFKIKFVDQPFSKSNDFIDLLSEHSIFIAPRRKEGIGQSFIEALSSGHAVLGFDGPTMNEYIKNNENGYLFDEKSSFIDFGNVESVIQNGIKSAETGALAWQKDKNNILDFVLSETQPAVKNSISAGLYRNLYKLKLRQFEFKNKY